MANKRTELLKWAKHFIDVCNKNKIWYSGDTNTILGAQRHGGFVPWNERFEVMMTPDAYQKLVRLFPENVINGNFDPEYQSLKPAFIKDRKSWEKDQPFIQIRVVVPTTIKHIKKFRSHFRSMISKMTRRKDNIKIAINDLVETRFEGYYTITSRFDSAISNWIPNLTLETVDMKFNMLKIRVVKEWKSILETQCGDNFMQAIIPNKTYTYPAPNKSILEED